MHGGLVQAAPSLDLASHVRDESASLYAQMGRDLKDCCFWPTPILASALLNCLKRLLFQLEPRRARQMDNTLLVVLLAIAVIAILAGVWFYYQRNSSKRLKQRFGPEYDRTVERLNNRDDAEKELRAREARVTRYKIVALSKEDSRRYHDRWIAVQAQFVDEPKVAVSEANFLIHRKS